MADSLIDFQVNIPGGTQIAAGFLGITSRLEASMLSAMEDITGVLHRDADADMQWKNPTGMLQESAYEIATPWQGTLGYAATYALRRDLGFSGMTDSLGRYYPFDPGKYYLEHSLDNNKVYIEARIGAAVQSAMTF